MPSLTTMAHTTNPNRATSKTALAFVNESTVFVPSASAATVRLVAGMNRQLSNLTPVTRTRALRHL